MTPTPEALDTARFLMLLGMAALPILLFLPAPGECDRCTHCQAERRRRAEAAAERQREYEERWSGKQRSSGPSDEHCPVCRRIHGPDDPHGTWGARED